MKRCGACRKPGHNRRRCPKPRRRGWFFKGRWRLIEGVPRWRVHRDLDERILASLGRVPISAGAIWQRIMDDVGTVSRRTIERRLARLRQQRRLTAEPTGINYADRFLYSRRLT